jgi:nickel/cobalt transporter (NicO) family protein
MSPDLGLLVISAASIGFIHTLLGPDHYVPFAALSAARGWSVRRTLAVTAFCGVGHVMGSILIGGVGIAVGMSVQSLQWLEGFRGDVAAWLLAGFGLAYMVWGLKRAWRMRPHTHQHVHSDGTVHRHEHGHHGGHLHPHIQDPASRRITPWALFIVFVLGPCEPLIPILMYPASKHSLVGTVAVALTFAATTLLTMLGVVYLAIRGLKLLPLDTAERYSHALAGAALAACGLGIVFLGL